MKNSDIEDLNKLIKKKQREAQVKDKLSFV